MKRPDRERREPTLASAPPAEPDDRFLIGAFPGAVFSLAALPELPALNPPAAALLALLAPETLGRFVHAAQSAQGSMEATSETIAANGTPARVFDITALPHPAHGLLLVRDSTLDRNLNAALAESRERYKNLVEISSDFAWETGPDGVFVFVSSRGALGYRAEELIGHAVSEFLLDGADGAPFAAARPVADVEIYFRRRDGTLASLRTSAVPMSDETGHHRGTRGICRDVTDIRALDADLARVRNREQVLSYILRTIHAELEPDAMLAAAAQTIAKGMGASGCRLYRVDPSGALRVAAAFGAELQSAEEARMAARLVAGESAEIESDGRFIAGARTDYRGRRQGAVVVWTNSADAEWRENIDHLLPAIADQLAVALVQLVNQEELARLSRTDPLTGLLNRRAFFAEAAIRLSQGMRAGRGAALGYVDLDNFKLVNDRLGHQKGDAALKAVGRILDEETRLHDLAGRLGGDEFALWLDETDEASAIATVERLLGKAANLASFSAPGAPPLGFSVGLALLDSGAGATVDQLAAAADDAMYAAKRSGKGTFRFVRVPSAAPGDPVRPLRAAGGR